MIMKIIDDDNRENEAKVRKAKDIKKSRGIAEVIFEVFHNERAEKLNLFE